MSSFYKLTLFIEKAIKFSLIMYVFGHSALAEQLMIKPSVLKKPFTVSLFKMSRTIFDYVTQPVMLLSICNFQICQKNCQWSLGIFLYKSEQVFFVLNYYFLTFSLASSVCCLSDTCLYNISWVHIISVWICTKLGDIQ